MTCSRCHGLIPDGTLSCLRCAEQASRAAFLALQRELLSRFLSGEYPFTLGRVTNSDHAHIQLIGEPTHAWCGEAMNRSKRWQRLFDELDRTIALCPKCRGALHKMAAEVTQGAV